MDLKLGDSLTKEIGEALSQAKVVLILISKSSLKSDWFEYEINIATERMIKEKIRLVPLLIDSVKPPKNLAGIVYGDYKKSPKKVLSKLILDLNGEYSNFEFTLKINRLNRYTIQVFGPVGYSWSLDTGPFTKSKDIEFVEITVGERRLEIFYAEAQSYSKDSLLKTKDWNNYLGILSERGCNSDQPAQYSLLVTDYAISGDLKKVILQIAERAFVKKGSYGELHMLADLSGEISNETAVSILKSLRRYFEDFIREEINLD
jgi:hypothetical protein